MADRTTDRKEKSLVIIAQLLKEMFLHSHHKFLSKMDFLDQPLCCTFFKYLYIFNIQVVPFLAIAFGR